MEMRMRGRARLAGAAPAPETQEYRVRRRTELLGPVRERGETVHLTARQAEHPLRQEVICTPEAFETELAAQAAARPAEEDEGEPEGRARGRG